MNDEILKELQYNGAVLEEMRSQNKAILEGQKGQASSADVRRLQQDVTELKQDMKVVRAATTDSSHQVHDLERRVSRLEAA
jgi:hypothetical protein